VKREEIAGLLQKYNIEESKITTIDIASSPHRQRYVERFADLRRRHGVTVADAHRILNSRNYFAMMMMEAGDADGVMIVPLSIAADVIAWAERLAAIEATIVAQLEAGEPREAVFSANPRFAHIGRL